MAKVELKKLFKTYNKKIKALEDINLTIEDGQFFVLLGPSGAGKTTTLRCIAGLEKIDSGDVLFNDENITHDQPASRDVTFVFQQYSLYPHYTVYENLAFPLRSPMRKLPEEEIKNKVEKIAEMLKITNKLKNKATELSGGEMQRVAIGRALVREPNIYLMDDFPYVNTLLLKYLKNSTRNNYEKSFHFKLFSNKSDKKYADDLADHSLRNFESNNELITKYAANWDIERLAKVDLVIINLAISELKEFRDIPVKVTLNEYIEISKDYSTEKSSFFINGILDKIVKDLIKNNSLIKEGRGLRE